MAEYSSSGIWVIGGGPKPFRHGMIEHATLRLPAALARRFDDWIEAYEHGHVRASGDRQIIRLVGNVVERHLAREQAR